MSFSGTAYRFLNPNSPTRRPTFGGEYGVVNGSSSLALFLRHSVVGISVVLVLEKPSGRSSSSSYLLNADGRCRHGSALQVHETWPREGFSPSVAAATFLAVAHRGSVPSFLV